MNFKIENYADVARLYQTFYGNAAPVAHEPSIDMPVATHVGLSAFIYGEQYLAFCADHVFTSWSKFCSIIEDK